MAKPSAANIREAAEVLEMDKYKEAVDTEKIVSTEYSSSGPSASGDADPDPLAHLPENFRKEIEAQATVVSRKVSFKVHCIEMELIAGTLSICRSPGKTTYALWDGDGNRIRGGFSAYDSDFRIGAPPLVIYSFLAHYCLH